MYWLVAFLVKAILAAKRTAHECNQCGYSCAVSPHTETANGKNRRFVSIAFHLQLILLCYGNLYHPIEAVLEKVVSLGDAGEGETVGDERSGVNQPLFD